MESRTTPMNTRTSGNLLANSVPPLGATVAVINFTVRGVTGVSTPGNIVQLVNPDTGVATGSLLIQSSGSFVFTPAPGYVGPVPTVYYNVRSSDGQIEHSALNIDVLPGKLTQLSYVSSYT